MESSEVITNQSPEISIDLHEISLRALISGISGQDQKALEKLYDITVNRLFSLAYQITRHTDIAEEVVSDVYLQVWQQASRYDPSRGKIMTWLYTICRSRALDHLRKKDRAETHPEPTDLTYCIETSATTPLDDVIMDNDSMLLQQALQIIEPSERQLVVLSYFRGMSHQEISDYTSIPLGTVKSVLRKALSSLRQHFGLQN